MQLAKFILYYAHRDLFPLEIHGCRPKYVLAGLWQSSRRILPTMLNIVSLGVLIVTVLVLWGVTAGADRQLNRMIMQNPRMLQVEAYLSSQVDSLAAIGPELIAQVEQLQHDGKTSGPKSQGFEGIPLVRAAHGWRDVSLRFYQANDSLMPSFSDGRTYDAQDPILEQMNWDGPAPPSLAMQDIGPGLIVSRKFLRNLGYDDEPVTTLYVQYRNRKAPVDVIAVTQDNWARPFMMDENFWALFRDHQWQAIKRYRHAYLGPMSSEQAAAAAEHISASYDQQTLTARPVERAGRARWVQLRFAADQGMAGTYLDSFMLPGVQQLLSEAMPTLKSIEFEKGDPIPLNPARTLDRLDDSYTCLTVYVTDIDHVAPTAAWLDAAGLAVDDDVMTDIEWAYQIKQFARGIGIAVIAVVCLLASANLYLTNTQSVQQRTPEVGVLKAFGAGPVTIMSIELTKATLIWLLAAPVGILVAMSVGVQAERFLIDTFALDSTMVLFHIGWPMLVGAAGGALLVSLVSTAAAAYMLSGLRPAVALRDRE